MSSFTPPDHALFWFRRDLRLSDNPALYALASAQKLTCIYILEEDENLRPYGGASRWGLRHALAHLEESLDKYQQKLLIFKGKSEEILPFLVQELNCDTITWNRRYGLHERALDRRLKEKLKTDGRQVVSFNANLLFEPMEINSQSGGFMRVFTPFWRVCMRKGASFAPLPAPSSLPPPPKKRPLPSHPHLDPLPLEALKLLPHHPDWAGGLRHFWGEKGEKISENAASEQLDHFIENHLKTYSEKRDEPAQAATSGMSTPLALGVISVRQIWQRVQSAGLMAGEGETSAEAKFFSELGWREFSYHLYYHAPELDKHNFQIKFNAFPWRKDEKERKAWQIGQTGYPIIDAGMRELWQTGLMHNRVRMLTASFLTKHLLHDWREGERWFWDTLIDADPANNPAAWQWVAGSGADAAPYFRIFNPTEQGLRFDTDGAYIRRFVPELARLPAPFIHAPQKAPPLVLAQAGVVLGKTYPWPMVDHAWARGRALAAFAEMKNAAI